MRNTIIVLMIATVLLCSCAQTQQGNNRAIGSGIGAISGAILGQALGGSTEATLIGGAIGAMVGYAVVTHVQSKTTQVYDSQQTKEMIPAAERKLPALQFRDKSISPSNTIRAGEEVTVLVSYLVYDETAGQTQIREKKTIWHNGEMIFELDENEEIRNNGTYESTCTFKLPDEIERGDYEVHYNVNTPFVSKNSTVPFSVI